MARDNGATRKGKPIETQEPASEPIAAPAPAEIETADEADTDETSKTVILDGNKVKHRFKWRPDENTKERREHETIFDFEGVTMDDLKRFYCKAQGTNFVQGKLRTLVKTNSPVNARSFAEVHVKNHIMAATRGGKSALTPAQAMEQSFINAGMTPEQVADAIKAINAIKAGKAQA